MFSYKAKNYALLTRDGEVVIKGGALKSRGLEKFQRVFLEEMIKLLMEGKPEAVSQLRENFEKKIRDREWNIEMLMKTDTLQDSLDKYRAKIGAGGRNLHQAIHCQLSIVFLEQILNLLLRFVVLAFAEVMEANVAGCIHQIVGGPV